MNDTTNLTHYRFFCTTGKHDYITKYKVILFLEVNLNILINMQEKTYPSDSIPKPVHHFQLNRDKFLPASTQDIQTCHSMHF